MTSESSTAKVRAGPSDDKHTTRPFSVRIARGDLQLVRRAAFVQEQSRSAFIVAAAVARAKDLLRARGELRSEDEAA